MAIFWCITPFLHWASILNTSPDLENELASLAAVLFIFFCLKLIFGLIGTILIADQRPAMNTFLEIITNLLSLIIVFVLTKTSSGSLFWLGFAISSATVIVPVIANFWFFQGAYKKYLPSLEHVKTEYAKELVSLGLKFFLLQMAGVVIFSSSNIIITQFYGPSEVTPYNIAFKYYGVASMAFLMVLAPFWSAYTDAYVRRDNEWIDRANRKLKKFWLALFVGVVLMTLAADRVYALWVGKTVVVPFSLSVSMAIYVLIIAWSNIFAYFINGTGKIRLQLWAAVIVSVLNIGLSILLADTVGLRSTGVVLATCIALLPGCILWPIQMKKLVAGTATGIWDK